MGYHWLELAFYGPYPGTKTGMKKGAGVPVRNGGHELESHSWVSDSSTLLSTTGVCVLGIPIKNNRVLELCEQS